MTAVEKPSIVLPNILTPREAYSPFEYPQAYSYWEKQQRAHWLHWEVSMNADVNDWKFKLTDNERNVVGHILKGFTQTEIFIEDFWANKVARWFKKPEIQMMANTFASFETIHAAGYAFLNQTLGLEDFGAYVHEPATKAKIDRLLAVQGKEKADIALALAIFSAFNEGVSLFSSFAILLNFKRWNKMRGIGTIIEWSIRDESLHSEAGCWLFNTFVAENPEVLTEDFKAKIYEAAAITVALEDAYIDKAFKGGDIEGLSANDLKQYIRFRTNSKLQDLGLEKRDGDLDMDAVRRITTWFDPLANGTQHTDFFATRSTNYSKGVVSFENVWGDQ